MVSVDLNPTESNDSNNNRSSEEFKALVLEASLGNSLLDTCFMFNVSPSVVAQWQRQEGIDTVLDNTEQYKSSKYSPEYIYDVLFYLKVHRG